MTPDEIVAELGRSDRVPRDALLAASGERDTLAPRLASLLERWIAAPSPERGAGIREVAALHLLAEWRTPGAFDVVCRFLACDAADVERACDDAITKTMARILVRLYDGDAAPLALIATAADVDAFVRAIVFDAIGLLTIRGRIDRAWTLAFLAECWETMRPRATSHAWFGWQAAVAAIGARDLTPAVRQAFDRDFIDPTILSFRDFEGDLAEVEADPTRVPAAAQSIEAPFDSALAEVEAWWPGGVAPHVAPSAPPPRPRPVGAPKFNKLRTVGRNDLCPCGSGKKFKKCCIDVYAGRS